MRVAVLRTNQRAVINDHRQRTLEPPRHGHGEVVPPAGHQRDFDAPARRFDNRGAIGLGQLPLAVEKRAVNINGDQTHGHGFILP